MPTTLLHHLPEAGVVARTLSGLIGRTATAKAGKPVLPAAKQPVVVATYVEAGGKLAAALILDLPLAASAGAALVMLPPVVAQEAVKSGKIEDNLAENLHEVLNVWAALFNSQKTPRVALCTVTTAPQLPEAVAALAKAPGGRVDLEVAISGYSSGRISVLVV